MLYKQTNLSLYPPTTCSIPEDLEPGKKSSLGGYQVQPPLPNTAITFTFSPTVDPLLPPFCATPCAFSTLKTMVDSYFTSRLTSFEPATSSVCAITLTPNTFRVIALS